MTNKNRKILYTGITNNIERRVSEHKVKEGNSFTSKTNCTIMVYLEEFNNVHEAIAREKQIKNWKRVWKEELINKENPKWNDLSTDWFSINDFDRQY